MGETADQLRQQVDQKRDDASQKIDQIEQQVMGKAQEIEHKVSDTAQQVKAKMDWRHQVEERPLLAVGAALIGGMLIGGLTGKDDGRDSGPRATSSHATEHSRGGVTNAVRNAARESGLEDSIQNFASAAFGQLGTKMRDMTERTFPGMLDKVQGAAETVSNAGRDTMTEERPRFADSGPKDSSAFAG